MTGIKKLIASILIPILVMFILGNTDIVWKGFNGLLILLFGTVTAVVSVIMVMRKGEKGLSEGGRNANKMATSIQVSPKTEEIR